MKLVASSIALAFATPVAATVPITIAPSGHATVPVEGSFGTTRFAFDTGAEGSAIYADFADRAGLPVSGTISLQGQTGTSQQPLVRIGRLTLDGTARAGIDAVRLNPRADGLPLSGVVGLDVFGDRTVDFDLPRMRLSILSPGNVPDDIAGDPVPATPIIGNLLTIPVRIGTATGVAVIDTGARKTRINWNMGRQLGLKPEALARGEVIQGATNSAVETRSTTVSDVHLGKTVLAQAPVLVADLPVFEAFGVADEPAIILGLDWLEATRMVVDFPGRRVWFAAAD